MNKTPKKVSIVRKGDSVAQKTEPSYNGPIGGIRAIPTPLRPTTKYDLAELHQLILITSGPMNGSDKEVKG